MLVFLGVIKQNYDEVGSDKPEEVVLHTVGSRAVEHCQRVLQMVKDYLDPEVTGQKHER